MQELIEKIIEKLEKELKLADKEKSRCARENPLQFDSAKGYANGVANSIEIVKQEAEQYEECYKDCGECEEYDKEKHHCPKFCKVIMETVKEIEENHNGWIPYSEPPKDDRYVLLSFDNFSVPMVGRYEEDEKGGSYYIGDEMEPCVTQDIFVNAWQPLPPKYQPKGE